MATKIHRRHVTQGLMGLSLFSLMGCGGITNQMKGEDMFGLIGKITAADGEADNLAAILLEGLKNMPGNLSYVVAVDPNNPNDLWVTEVWESEAAHQSSLNLPSVQVAIQKGRPLIAGMEPIATTKPIGGHGI